MRREERTERIDERGTRIEDRRWRMEGKSKYIDREGGGTILLAFGSSNSLDFHSR